HTLNRQRFETIRRAPVRPEGPLYGAAEPHCGKGDRTRAKGAFLTTLGGNVSCIRASNGRSCKREDCKGVSFGSGRSGGGPDDRGRHTAPCRGMSVGFLFCV